MSYDPNAPKVYRSPESKDRPFCGRCGLEYAYVGSGPSRWGTGSREDTYQPQCPCWTAAPKPEPKNEPPEGEVCKVTTIWVAPRTLRSIRHAHPHLFRQDQVWFDREAFMDTPLPEGGRNGAPVGAVDEYEDEEAPGWISDDRAKKLPLAVELIHAFVHDPLNPIWDRYLWCRDTDSQGQRVYLGKNNGLMEIHRHLHLTERWGVPVWA